MVDHQFESDTEKLSQLAKEYWTFYLDEHPEVALECGVRTELDVFFRESIEDYDRRHIRHLDFSRQLKALNVTGFHGQDETTRILLQRELHEAITQYELQAHLRPFWFPFGPDMHIVFAIQSTNLTDSDSIDAFIKRLGSIPGYFNDCLERLKLGIRNGYKVPVILVKPILANVRAHLKDPEDGSACWYVPLQQLASHGPANLEGAKARVERLARDIILPAWRDFADQLDQVLCSTARESISCLDEPGGSDYYRLLMKHHTTLDVSPEEVHRIGVLEVARILEEMRALIKHSGRPGGLSAMRKFLQSDAQFIASSKEELISQIEILSKKIDRKIPGFFSVIPRMTYGVECIPEEVAPQMPPAYAQANPANRQQSGIHWVTSLPERCPSYQHIPLALHEAWPGHLMHIALLKENRNVPDFVRHGFMSYTALLEGWALYCERLGIEFGLYKNIFQNIGRLEMELWRALRLVVDTGIHVKAWSRPQAIEYMQENSALSHDVIESEVDRYIGMPAQALAYKLGEMKILELRNFAEQTLGPVFELRRFHDCVMNAGAVTLPLLEQRIRHWVASGGESTY